METTIENKTKFVTKAELDELFKSRNEKNPNSIIKIEDCIIMNMDLSDYDLYDLVLRDVEFRNVEFYYTSISNWDAKEVIFIGCTVNRTKIENSSFTNCMFNRTNFTDNLLQNSDFCRCDIGSLNAPRTTFKKVSITNSTVIATNFTMSDFCDCTIEETVFYSCCFFRATFDNTNVEVISTLLNDGLSLACPEVGSFIGYKKIFIDQSNINGKAHPGQAIVKLLIPEDARRSSATSKKCRCDKAKVLEILDFEGNKLSVNKGYSSYAHSFKYEVGKMISVCNFNEDRWEECAAGIHFFTSFQDAVEYYIR